MAGHISEKRWADTSDEVNRTLVKLLQFVGESENLYQELVQLWQYHGGATENQKVANQLFEATATPQQVAMTVDMRNAIAAAHALYQAADLAAMRKMT